MTRHVIAPVDELPPGTRKFITIDERPIAIFNIKGEFFGLLNRCPHQGAALCEGPLIGLAQSSDPGEIEYTKLGEIIRCPWHGWEFDIRTGQSYCDPKRFRARAYPVNVEPGSSVVKGPFVAETIKVAVESDYVAGTLKVNQTPEIVSDTGTISVWDARAGYGQVVARQAVEWAIGAARQHGVAVNGLRNAHHIGRVGTYGEIAARAGMVALHFVNVASGPPPVAPFRGREGRFLTNPVCIAIPGTDNNEPILLDFATSRVALGKVRVAHNAGKPMLDGALLDHSGQPTTDPSVMYTEPRGVVLPFGEHKGSGLALVCELLAGAIVGSASVTTSTPPERGIINGMLSIVIDPARLSARDSMLAEIDAMIGWVKSAKPSDPELPVLVAGEPERIARAERLAKGIEIDDETWSQLSAIAERYQISLDH